MAFLTCLSVLQEPSPLMLASAHLALGSFFDMNELYGHLVTTGGNKGKTKVSNIFVVDFDFQD